MRASIANLTSIALLTHVVLGCCWHHGHGGRPATADNVVVDRSHDHGQCGHNHASAVDPCGEDHQGRDGCNASRCVFVAAGSLRAAAAPAAQLCNGLNVAADIDDACPTKSRADATLLAAR